MSRFYVVNTQAYGKRRTRPESFVKFLFSVNPLNSVILRQHTHSYVKLRFAALLFVFGWLLVPSPALPADDDDDLTTSEVRRFLRRAKVDSKLIDDFLTRYRDGQAGESDMRLLAKREK